MHRTVEAIIHPDGTIEALESVDGGRQRRALLTILDELPHAAVTESATDDEDARVEAILRAAGLLMEQQETAVDRMPLSEAELDALWERLPSGTPLSQIVSEDREERF